jgi:uncharacterized membrane protein YeiB
MYPNFAPSSEQSNKMEKKQRIIGFDLARAYAVLGMYIVNFNTVFGSFTDKSTLGQFLGLFNGNSSTTFVILAGMGIALMTNRSDYSLAEKSKLKKVISRRSWFLFVIGLLLYIWWPADILHYYGGYMHLAILILFVPPKYYWWAAGVAIIIFHVLFAIIPYETGWNFKTLEYTDFWTINGFLRNTLYNGWNSIFPWVAYFFAGMWLGRLEWSGFKIQRNVFLIGLSLLVFINASQMYATQAITDTNLLLYITADYIPPFLPFMLSTFGFALMLISTFMFIGSKFEHHKYAKLFAATGQMTLTHYISHLTIGMMIFSLLTSKNYVGYLSQNAPTSPLFILLFAVFYFILSCLFSKLWTLKFKNGPVETLMRKISG